MKLKVTVSISVDSVDWWANGRSGYPTLSAAELGIAISLRDDIEEMCDTAGLTVDDIDIRKVEG